MPSISLKNIPSQFKVSGLYYQLIEGFENDEEVEIELPEKHATFTKDKNNIPTIEYLINQLETVRFWCTPEIPQYVYETIKIICGGNPSVLCQNDNFMNYLEIYDHKKELRYALNLDTYVYNPLVVSSIYGFPGYFKYMYQKMKQENAEKENISKKWAIRSNNKLLHIIVYSQKIASLYGQIDMLKILFDIHTCENVFPALLEMAAKGGHYECMKYLLAIFSKYNHKMKWKKDTCKLAAISGSLPCLKLAHENGAVCEYLVASYAAEYGHFECYRYLCEIGCSLSIEPCRLNQHTCDNGCFNSSYGINSVDSYCMWKHYSCNLAAANGHYYILKYGIEHGGKITDAAIVYAAKYNHITCLYYLIDLAMKTWSGIGCPYLPIVVTFIIKNNGLDMLKTIYEKHKYWPFNPNHPNQAAETGNPDMVRYIIDIMNYANQPYHDNVCRHACHAPSDFCIKELHKAGFQMNYECVLAAAKHGVHSTFVYVIENSANHSDIQDKYIYLDLVKRGKFESLKYLHKLGSELPKDLILYCIVSGDYADCLEYLLDNTHTNMDELLCLYAARNNNFHSLKLLHEKYGLHLRGCLHWAVVNNNPKLFQYVFEHTNKDITWEMYKSITKNKQKYKVIRKIIEDNVDINGLYKHYIQMSNGGSS